MLHDIIVFIFLEGTRLLELSLERARFAGQALYEHTHCHSRGEGVRVDDDVGHDTCLSKGHVFVRPQHRENTFLTMT